MDDEEYATTFHCKNFETDCWKVISGIHDPGG